MQTGNVGCMLVILVIVAVIIAVMVKPELLIYLAIFGFAAWAIKKGTN